MTFDPSALTSFITALKGAYGATGHEAAERLLAKLAGWAPEPAALAPAQVVVSNLWLETALGYSPSSDLLDAARAIAPDLHWLENLSDDMPESFINRHAYCTIAGPGALLPTDDFYIGLYLQAPDTYYPAHAHDAEELYLVLSGAADWHAGKDQIDARPGRFIHHPSTLPHIMETGEAPLLAVWAWMGQLDGRFWYPETNQTL